MKTAIVTMARDEDLYVREWLDYHYRLGFDEIFILEHAGWKCRERASGRLHLVPIDFKAKQFSAIERQVKQIKDSFDWIAVIDIDEFIVLKNGSNDIKDFLEDYSRYNALALNWRLFGSSGKIYNEDENSVLRRFTRCGYSLHPWIKLILNCGKMPDGFKFKDVHTLIDSDGHLMQNIVNASKRHHVTEDRRNDEDFDEILGIAWIAHFKTKTYREFIARMDKGCGYFYFPKNDEDLRKLYSRFYEFNLNDVEELALLNFQRTGRFLT